MWDKDKQTNKIKEKANPDDDQSRKIFSLRPYHPECAQSCLVSKAKQGWASLYLDGRQIFRGDCSETSSLETNAIKVQTESLVPDLSKNNQG
jgi:hypothetical protein